MDYIQEKFELNKEISNQEISESINLNNEENNTKSNEKSLEKLEENSDLKIYEGKEDNEDQEEVKYKFKLLQKNINNEEVENINKSQNENNNLEENPNENETTYNLEELNMRLAELERNLEECIEVS